MVKGLSGVVVFSAVVATLVGALMVENAQAFGHRRKCKGGGCGTSYGGGCGPGGCAPGGVAYAQPGYAGGYANGAGYNAGPYANVNNGLNAGAYQSGSYAPQGANVNVQAGPRLNNAGVDVHAGAGQGANVNVGNGVNAGAGTNGNGAAGANVGGANVGATVNP